MYIALTNICRNKNKNNKKRKHYTNTGPYRWFINSNAIN